MYICMCLRWRVDRTWRTTYRIVLYPNAPYSPIPHFKLPYHTRTRIHTVSLGVRPDIDAPRRRCLAARSDS